MDSVYVISAGSNRHKVGRSADPRRRMATLQTAHYERLSLSFSMQHEEASELERCAHHLLRPARLSGEWFDVTLECAIAVVKRSERAWNHHNRNIRFAAGDRVICVADGRIHHPEPYPTPGRVYTVNEACPKPLQITLVEMETSFWLPADSFLPAPTSAYSFGIALDLHSADNDGLGWIEDVGDVV